MKKDIRTRDRLRRCKNCNRNFYWVRKWQKFCSEICRWENWEKNNPRVKRKELEKLKETYGSR